MGGLSTFFLICLNAFVARGFEGQISGWAFTVLWIVSLICGSAIGIAVYAWATREWSSPPPIEPETRCRNCGYILRGITEPRCPECGEVI